ncbi:MAG: isochorismatase, partial [Cyanobacteria bacterium P01_D01_bin.44]
MPTQTTLPLPPFFDPARVGEVWRVPYEARATQAKVWAKQHGIPPASADRLRVCLLAIDVQNTFCIPDFELFVGGRSGMGAVDDNVRLCEFIYHNISEITEIIPTLDTHTVHQIFHANFWVDEAGQNPPPMTLISLDEVERGRWQVNPAIASSLGRDLAELQGFTLHYARRLSE